MSESMTVEQAMAQAADAKRWVENGLYADNKLAIAGVVLADEVERLRNAEKSLAAFSGDVLGSADSVIQRLSEERAALQARVAELEAALQQQVAVADNANKLNSDLCSRAFSLEQERDELLSRLPDGMKHCTIVFKECEKGHGWLTATNWAQHGCPTCERDELRRLLNDAATSLETISRLAGRDEFMTDLSDIRTYAANRAKCARKANQIEREGGV